MKPSRISNSSNGTRAQDEGEEFRKENKKSSQKVSRGETAKRVEEDRKVPYEVNQDAKSTSQRRKAGEV